MDIHIPAWLITSLFYAVATMAFIIGLGLAIRFAYFIIKVLLERRSALWYVSLWLFCRKYRNRSEEYTNDMLENVAKRIKKEDPVRYKRLISHFHFGTLDKQTERILFALERHEAKSESERRQSDLYSVIHEALLEASVS